MTKRSGKIGTPAVDGVPKPGIPIDSVELVVNSVDLANVGQTYPGLSITTHSEKFSQCGGRGIIGGSWDRYYQRPYFELTLYGRVVFSKKNRYTPTKKGFKIGTDLRADLEEMERQVPGELRDLMLVHPDVEVLISTPKKKVDRDGVWTTVCDILVRCGVIAGDDIQSFNGRLTILPAAVSATESVRVVLWPTP